MLHRALLVALVLLSFGAAGASAQRFDYYAVGRLAVDATAETNLAARRQAFEGAQRRAVARLLQQIGAQGVTVDSFSDADITAMIQGLRINREFSRGNRYYAELTYYFRQEVVDQLVAERSGAPAIAAAPDPVTQPAPPVPTVAPEPPPAPAPAIAAVAVPRPEPRPAAPALAPAAPAPETAVAPDAPAAAAPPPEAPALATGIRDGIVRVAVPLRGADDWFQIRQQLGRANLDTAPRTVSLTPGRGVVEFRFDGSERALSAALGAAGLALDQGPAGLQLRRL